MKFEVKWILIGPVSTMLMAATAYATPPIKTGLWEEVTTVKRAQIPARTVTTQICLTSADLERVDQRVGQMGTNRSCKLENQKRSDRSTSAEWACSAKGVSMRGHGEVIYDDSTHFHVSTTQQTTAGGRVIDTILTSKSRWISAECGNVKPLSEYTKK